VARTVSIPCTCQNHTSRAKAPTSIGSEGRPHVTETIRASASAFGGSSGLDSGTEMVFIYDLCDLAGSIVVYEDKISENKQWMNAV